MPRGVISSDESEIDYYRARFRQPKDNPLGVRVPYIVSVDLVRATRNTWKAVETTERATFQEVKRGPSEEVKARVEALFEETVLEWIPYDKFGNKVEPKTRAFF